MPRKPKRPCSFPGCPELVEGRYCEKHKRKVDRHYNRHQRDPKTAKRYGRRWRKIRKVFLTAHPLCELCREQGRYTPAEEVHHIKPLSEGGTHDYENLMALCKSCHSRITAKEGGRWG
jgi:5-methylcytosine-specific restriction protein A